MSAAAIVGIDLGTTNSAIAVVDASGQPVLLANAEGSKTTPSVVQVRADGSVVVGEAAKQEVILEKENTAHFFKRDMGTDAVYDYHGRPWTPVDLSAAVLRKLKRDGEAALGTEISRAVITVPAYFMDGARLATKVAGEKAGLEVTQIINEPTAAALAYGLQRRAREEVVMVYDLGGGTFDISLVRVAKDGVDVLGTDGDHWLGGKDWDDRLVQHVCEEFRRRHGVDPLDDAFTFQEILIRAEEAKKALSQRDRTAVPVSSGGVVDRVEVTRRDFEAMTRDLLTRTEMLMSKLLDETGHSWAQIGSVLLVGGSTRLPMVADLVRRLGGKAPNTAVNPDECVAAGAAIQGSFYGENRRGPGGIALRRDAVRDVISHSMGMIAVSADGERYVNSLIIPRNRPIPCREVRPYKAQTSRDSATSVYVTQGEGEDPASCSFVGKYLLQGIPPSKERSAVVDIAYEYDSSGVVRVLARDRASGCDLVVVKEPVPRDMSWIHASPRDAARVEPKTVLIAVDLSGSMSGKPLEDARAAVSTFLDQSDLSHTAIGVLSFADSIQIDIEPGQDAKRIRAAFGRWRIGSVGIGNGTHPFDQALNALAGRAGARFLVVLTDGAWSDQRTAERQARACHASGIEVVAIGFGGADREFLRRIATCDEAAVLARQGDLSSVFGEIAQVIVESTGASGIAWQRSR